jgi:predicted Fe-Mo cluster-binding NifX family protein
MKVAISTDGGYVSAHFGRCPEFTLIDIEDGKIIKKEVIKNPGHHSGFLPQFLKEKSVDCIVAGSMGARAKELFSKAGIDTIMGVKGKVKDIADKLAAGTLEGGEGICIPGSGKGYGIDKSECDHK